MGDCLELGTGKQGITVESRGKIYMNETIC